MRSRINAIYHRPYPKAFYNHFRDSVGLTEEYKAIMDSLHEHQADSHFHYDNTMLPEAKFESYLKTMSDMHLSELIRLAMIGFQTENERRTQE